MSDALINWFVVNLGGKVGKELILFIISMVPILELRGGLLAAGPTFLNIPMWRAIPVHYRKYYSGSIYSASDHKDF